MMACTAGGTMVSLLLPKIEQMPSLFYLDATHFLLCIPSCRCTSCFQSLKKNPNNVINYARSSSFPWCQHCSINVLGAIEMPEIGAVCLVSGWFSFVWFCLYQRFSPQQVVNALRNICPNTSICMQFSSRERKKPWLISKGVLQPGNTMPKLQGFVLFWAELCCQYR